MMECWADSKSKIPDSMPATTGREATEIGPADKHCPFPEEPHPEGCLDNGDGLHHPNNA